MEPPELPRDAQGRIELQEFVDPLFGSERYLKFKAHWIAEVEDKLFPLPLAFWRKYPVTIVTLKNGRKHMVVGYWARQLRAAMADAASPAGKVVWTLKMGEAEYRCRPLENSNNQSS